MIIVFVPVGNSDCFFPK